MPPPTTHPNLDVSHPQWQQRADLYHRLNAIEAQRRQYESDDLAAQAARELELARQATAWAKHYRSLDPYSTQGAQCEAAAYHHHQNHLSLGELSREALSGRYTADPQRVRPIPPDQWEYANTDTGQVMPDPAPADRRPYGRRGGLRPPLQRHQDDLSEAMPRNPDGMFVRHPDPRQGHWFVLANDGGAAFDPSRGVNCLDCMLSFLQTWRGVPRVSAPRTFDGYQGTNALSATRGEEHGMRRAQDITGGRWQQITPDAQAVLAPEQVRQAVDQGYARVDAQLRHMGPGSAMLLVTEFQQGGSHAWLAVNQGGDILYLDPQSGHISQDTPLYPHTGNPANPNNTVSIQGIPIDPRGVAQQMAMTTQAVQTPAPTDPMGLTPGGTPFDFERFISNPQWSAEATQFELRLGAHFFNDERTLTVARAGLTRMREVLMALTPRLAPDETDADFQRRVESTFFRDDSGARSSAGQVGRAVSLDELLERGNLRELMTAFYNAAYVNAAGGTLKLAVMDVIDQNRWGEAGVSGLDLDQVRRMEHQLDESWNRLVLGRLAPAQFGRDPFGSGNVGMLSDNALRDMLEVRASQRRRRDRTDDELTALASTAGGYAALGTPLGRFEREFIESFTGPLTDTAPLPWREGTVLHGTANRWMARMTQQGFPVIDGISMTTARMLTAARFLRLDQDQQQDFLNALIGWMLPCQDHSLLEILRGAQIAGVDRLTAVSAGVAPVDLYRDLTGLDIETLRAQVAVRGLLPHEALYLARAADPDGFTETQHPKVQEIANRIWPQLSSGRVTDSDVAEWLDRNGIDPRDEAAVRALSHRLTLPHLMALTVYTRHSHYLINNVIRTHLFTFGLSADLVQNRLGARGRKLVKDYLRNLAADNTPLPLPLLLRTVLHTGEGHLDSRSPLSDIAQQWIDAARRESQHAPVAGETMEAPLEELLRPPSSDRILTMDQAWRVIEQRLDELAPRLFDEMRWHADMVHDAMAQLPFVGSPEEPVTAFRGDWITPVWSPIYGSRYVFPTGRANEFLSVSRIVDVAVRFMIENPARGGAGRVIVVYRLTGRHAHDVSVFSSFPEDEEAVLPPGSRTRRVRDAKLEDMVRKALPAEYRGSCQVIVMEEI